MNITNNVSVNDTIAETFNYGATDQTAQGQILPGYQFANGTAQGQVDLHWENPAPVTLAAGASVTYILSALVDGITRAVAFARVRKYLLWITSRTDGDYLTVGGASVDPWTAIPTHQVYDLELKVCNTTAGLPVTAGVSDQLKVTNSGSNPITFRLALGGASV